MTKAETIEQQARRHLRAFQKLAPRMHFVGVDPVGRVNERTQCGLVVGLVDDDGRDRFALVFGDFQLWAHMVKRQLVCAHCLRSVAARRP